MKPSLGKSILLVAAGVGVGALVGLWPAGMLQLINDWKTYDE